MLPKLMVHGGAWDWDDALDEEKGVVLEEAVTVGYEILQKGRSALAAVEQTVIVLEDSHVFDAGRGGYLNQNGQVQLDALIVDGEKRDFGAVGGVTRIKNPITLARKIMEETEHCFFVGAGADEMAAKLGIQLVDNSSLITAAMDEHYQAQRTAGPSDTVGAIALDSKGNVAAATSTSGTPYKPAGRVGDSPLFGAGGYAENGLGVAGATGQGEQIMRFLLSKYVCDKLAENMTAPEAANAAMRYMSPFFDHPMAGVIVIDRQGNLGAAYTTPKLALGWVDKDGRVRAAMQAQPSHLRQG